MLEFLRACGGGIKCILLELIDNETLVIVFLFVIAMVILGLLTKEKVTPEIVSLASGLLGSIIGGFVGFLKGFQKGAATQLPPIIEELPPPNGDGS